MPRIPLHREEFLRQIKFSKILSNLDENDSKYILEHMNISVVENFLRDKKLRKIEDNDVQ